jgi:hypothetical protein
MARGLRAIAAILGTAAGFDRQQRGELHRIRVEMFAVQLLRAEHQVGERQFEQGFNVCDDPALRRGGTFIRFIGRSAEKLNGLYIHIRGIHIRVLILRYAFLAGLVKLKSG